MGARPLYEFTWGHATLHAINVDRNITYLQALYPAFGFMEKVAEIDALFSPDEFLRHLEFTRYAGQVTAYGLDLIKYTTDERLERDHGHSPAPRRVHRRSAHLDAGGQRRLQECRTPT